MPLPVKKRHGFSRAGARQGLRNWSGKPGPAAGRMRPKKEDKNFSMFILLYFMEAIVRELF
jgi:hypothetical protein